MYAIGPKTPLVKGTVWWNVTLDINKQHPKDFCWSCDEDPFKWDGKKFAEPPVCHYLSNESTLASLFEWSVNTFKLHLLLIGRWSGFCVYSGGIIIVSLEFDQKKKLSKSFIILVISLFCSIWFLGVFSYNTETKKYALFVEDLIFLQL